MSTRIDINAPPPAREPDAGGSAGGLKNQARRGRAPASSADIDGGDSPGAAPRSGNFAKVPGAPHHARYAEPSQAGLSRKELIAGLSKPKQSALIHGVPRRDGRAAMIDPDNPEALPDAGERDGQIAPLFWTGEMAAIVSAIEKVKKELANQSRGLRKSRGNNEQSAGPAEEDGMLTAHERGLLARADRVHYLAMAAMAGTLRLRAPAPRAAGTLPAIKPQSRAECQRRCGNDGFCDPSDPLGCGGEYCAARKVGPARD